MSQEHNKRLVRRALEEINTPANLDLANELTHPDFADHEPAPHPEQLAGPESAKQTGEANSPAGPLSLRDDHRSPVGAGEHGAAMAGASGAISSWISNRRVGEGAPEPLHCTDSEPPRPLY